MSGEVAQGRIARVEFTGTRSDLFGLLCRGYLLMLPTLGIYRFWVTTWKRRFYWHNTVIDGEPLEYTGNALQLLVGFLFAVAFFLPIYIALFYLSTQSPGIVIVGYLVIGALLWFLTGYAIYRARDFRLSRTLWRGIRFNQYGNAWGYALRRFLWSIAMVATLGLIYPAMASNLWRYRYDNTWYGDRRFHWGGSWKTIAGPFYTTYFLVVASVIGGVIVLGAAPSMTFGGTQMPGPLGWLGLIGASVVAFLCWFYFRSREASRMFSEVHVGVAKATVKVRARGLLGQFMLYLLALTGAGFVLSALAGILLAGILGNALSGGSAVDFAQFAQSSWLTILALVLGYLVILASFALLGEVFLGYGYWMLVARGATIANADSLGSVRAAGEDRALAGEGLADALNVGAY